MLLTLIFENLVVSYARAWVRACVPACACVFTRFSGQNVLLGIFICYTGSSLILFGELSGREEFDVGR